MKRLLAVVVVGGLVLVTWLLASSRQLTHTPPQRAGGRPSLSADPLAHARLERLNTVVGELSGRVDHLEEELRSVKGAFRESLARRAPGAGEEFRLLSYLD